MASLKIGEESEAAGELYRGSALSFGYFFLALAKKSNSPTAKAVDPNNNKSAGSQLCWDDEQRKNAPHPPKLC